MSMRPSDLVFYAGGEALRDYGVFVRRTAPAEDNPETLTRSVVAPYVDPAGVDKLAAANIPRADWVDLDSDGVRETPMLRLDAQDEFCFPWWPAPQAMTIYAYYEERGVSGGIAYIGNAGDTGARLYLHNNAGALTAFHHNESTAVQSALSELVDFYDQVEVLLTLSAAGVVQVSRRVNNGAITASAASGALALASAWGDRRIYINSLGSGNNGERGYRAVKVALGTYTMDDMAGARSGGNRSTRLYPMFDAGLGMWGWTEVPGEAGGIINASGGVLGVDNTTTVGGAVVRRTPAGVVSVITTS